MAQAAACSGLVCCRFAAREAEKVEAIGVGYFSEWKISETPEQKNVWYYGPLPVKEIETND